MAEKRAIVIDTGSRTTKCGYSGSILPVHVFPSIVGRTKVDPGLGPNFNSVLVGEKALKMRGVLKLKIPIQHGMVANWRNVEELWNYSLRDVLKTDLAEHPILLTEPPHNSKREREKMMSLFFETFNASKFHSADHSILSLFSYGKTSGCVLESGGGVTHTCPILDGYHVSRTESTLEAQSRNSHAPAIRRLMIGGENVTDYLTKILCEKGYEMYAPSERVIVRDMKEKLCYVSDEYNDEFSQAIEDENPYLREYILPDERKVSIGTERFRAPELMFSPAYIGSYSEGVHEMLFSSITNCEVGYRNVLFENIVLGGGNTMFDGMRERIEKLVLASAPPRTNVKVHARKDRTYSSWIGGSILASLSSFYDIDNLWVTKDDYDESGVNVVHQKCSSYSGVFSGIEESMLHFFSFGKKEDDDLKKERVEFVMRSLSFDDEDRESQMVTRVVVGGESIFRVWKFLFW